MICHYSTLLADPDLLVDVSAKYVPVGLVASRRSLRPTLAELMASQGDGALVTSVK
jgi:hypothetical protein